jgi:outer membrane protein OmpA-like peptidoglycan-associated protein
VPVAERPSFAGPADVVPDPEAKVEPPPDEEGMSELRSLLLGPAEKQLAEVHSRLTDPQRQLKEVAHLLPAAVAVRSRQDDELTDAMAPTVAAALDRSIRKDPQPLADALFPVMGPAIRKAIAAALSGMIESFNQSLNHSLSVRGLRWRFEALRTGRSFAEVVMMHTLLYRVEQVFLIHKETGLLLRQVSAGGAAVQDADMVSGMLTAIQDFVHDSFSAGRDDQLETLQVGELTVWIEQGPLAVLAGVIRGNAPSELRTTFRETLERIHLQYGAAMKEFSGDAAPFAPAEELLEECLQSRYHEAAQPARSGGVLTPFRVLAGVLLLAVLVGGFFWIRNQRRWDGYVSRLRSEPGIVVTDAEKRGWKYHVGGLRDPLAIDPQVILRESGIDPRSVVDHWEPFTALSPEMVLARAKKMLAPPATVNLKVEDNTLEVDGFASHPWVLQAREAVRWLPGLGRLREDNLLDLERIEDPLLMFQLDRAELVPGQEDKFSRLTADIGRLQAQAQAMQKKVRLEIVGHTDGSGTEARNDTLSAERAQTVAQALQARLPVWTNLTVEAVGTKERLRDELTEADRATNRSVTFRVITTDVH